MITQTYSLDLIPNFAPLVVHVSQYDVGSRTLVFNLTKGGIAYSGNATGATIKGTKPDGHGFMYSMTLDGSTASIVVTEQMTAVAGMTTCEVVLTDGTAVLGSANFTLFVEHTALDSETVISDTDIPVFEELTRQATTASTQAQQYAQQARESAESIDVSELEAQIASKAPSVSPTLRFGITASANGNSNPHVELRETGSTPIKGMGIAIYNEDGTLKSINDLVTSAGNRNFATVSEVNAKAPLASPALTGTPTAPTASVGTSTNQLATTAFVQNQFGGWRIYAPSAFSTSQTLVDICASMASQSIYIYGTATYDDFGGGMPTVGVLEIKKYANGRCTLELTRALANTANPDRYLAMYNHTTSSITAWTRTATDLAIGSAVSLKNCDCLLIGNSFAYGTGGTGGHGWCYYFQQRTGCTAQYIRQNGGDFVAVGNDHADYKNMTYLQALTAYTATRTAEQKNAVKYIIVGGGYNDTTSRNSGGASAVKTAIASFVTYCRTNYPQARIWIIPLFSPTIMSTQKEWDVIKEWSNSAVANGVATCVHAPLWFEGKTQYNSDISGDVIHLNDAGYQLAGAYIASLVYGWDGLLAGQTIGTTRTLYNSGNVTIRRNGRKVMITMNGASALPNASAINATAQGLSWTPVSPATRYIPCWEYSTGTVAFVQLNGSSGLTNPRAMDKTALTSYRLYTTFEYDVAYDS